MTSALNNAEDKKKALKDSHADVLFYTLVINYSIYSYNSIYFKPETDKVEGADSPYAEDSWIANIFHKNDSYQIPEVLTPMRTDGNININNEEYLSRQRLMVLYVSAKNKEGREVNEKKFAVGFCFKLEEESKLVKYTLNKGFRDTKYDYYDHQGKESIASSIGYYPRAIEFFATLSMGLFGDKFDESEKESFTSNTSFYDKINKAYEAANDGSKESSGVTDWANFLGAITLFNLLPDDKTTKRIYLLKRKLTMLNLSQTYRVYSILKVWNIFKIEYEQWGEINNVITDYEANKNPISAAKLYCTYKVLSILETYRPYRDNTIYHSISKTNYVFSCSPHRVAFLGLTAITVALNIAKTKRRDELLVGCRG